MFSSKAVNHLAESITHFHVRRFTLIFDFEVVRVCSFVYCNGVYKSDLFSSETNSNETLQLDTTGFHAAFSL